jgi:hypothetical protein
MTFRFVCSFPSVRFVMYVSQAVKKRRRKNDTEFPCSFFVGRLRYDDDCRLHNALVVVYYITIKTTSSFLSFLSFSTCLGWIPIYISGVYIVYNNICTVFFSLSGWLFSFSRFGGENKGGRRGNKRDLVAPSRGGTLYLKKKPTQRKRRWASVLFFSLFGIMTVCFFLIIPLLDIFFLSLQG